jgi:hypothetical protein
MSEVRILAVQAREIHVTMEIPISIIRSILRCTDATVVELDMKDPDNERAYREFSDFVKFLDEFNKGIKDGRVE